MMFQLSKQGKLLAAIVAASSLVACSGDDGDDGAAGPVGEQGPAGPQGPAGADGQDGADGSAGADGADGADGQDGADGIGAGITTEGLTRLGTVPLGAEVTGAFITEEGDLFFNVQHPDSSNDVADQDGRTFHTGTVGVVTGLNINQLPKNVISVQVPRTEEEQETVQLAAGEYQVLGQTGDTYAGGLAEGLATVMSADGTEIAAQSDMPDFNGFIYTGENEGYLFSNWEFVPGGMSRIKLEKDANSGRWSVDNTDVQMLDFGADGTIANCFGSVSPWGTPLTSEEWGNLGDDTHLWNSPEQITADGFGQNLLTGYLDPTASSALDADPFPNTYRYHYIVEITNPTSANPTPVKRYAMGRYEHENSVVMPDQRTAYLSQDNTNGVFFKFVADNPGDLSAGTLYGAKLTQDAGSTEPLTTGFDITWIELASGNSAQIETWIAEYDAISDDDFVEGKSNYLTDADAIAWANGDANYPSFDTAYQPAVDAGFEGANTFGGSVTAGEAMDDRIAFLESRKAARAKGATAEWRKFEGIMANMKRAEEAVEGTDLVPGYDVTDAYVYFAIADMDNGMIDDEGDIQLSNRVKECGGVYRMKLEADYDVSRIEPVLMGSTFRSGVDDTEQCDVNAVAQPDNVIVMDDGRILLGEDGDQANNTLWLYEPKVNN